MPESLHGKLVVLLLAVLAIVGIVQIALLSRSAQLYFQEVTQEVNRDVAQKVAGRRDILAHDAFDATALKRLFSELMTTHPSIEVYALDPTGNIVAFSAPPDAVVRSHVSLEPLRALLGGARLPVLGDDPRSVEGQRVFAVAPVRASTSVGARLAGYIYVILEGQPYQSAVQRLQGSYILRQSVMVAAASLIFAILAALYVLRVLTRHLRRLAGTMQAFESSGFTEPPAITERRNTADEVDRLESMFAVMAARMVAQVKQIRNVDSLRRELLANVSHDLRTPLASLQGYLDTVLMKGDQLSVNEQHEFLRIAARHGERLSRLIEDLFELAKLDAVEVPLHCEWVSMAELVQDSLQKAGLAAQRKGIQLRARLEHDAPPVSVDVAMIARVIDNLLDNALRHTAAAGTVEASVVAKPGRIAVLFDDTGCGIAAEHVPWIFDRFYQVRADGANGDGATKQRGLGLGLAVAKQIVERHGGSIAVTSTVGVGTQFSFELPSAARVERSSAA